MSGLREIKRRIGVVKNIQQITKAMKMVAAARLRKAQDSILSIRPYAEIMNEVIASLAFRAELDLFPLLTPHEGNRTELVVITSDKGLCGGFNSNILRRATDFLAAKSGELEISITTIGKKAAAFFRKRGITVRKEFVNVFDELDYKTAGIIGDEIIVAYIESDIDQAYFIYNKFKSMISQEVVIEKLLPIEPMQVSEKTEELYEEKAKPQGPATIDYLYEPSKEVFLNSLLDRHMKVQMYRMLLESLASEFGARMTAMEAATNNAGDLIDSLTLMYNRARQSSITTEIIEIISGSEALR